MKKKDLLITIFISENKLIQNEIKQPFEKFLRNSQYTDLYHMKLPGA